MGMSNVIHSSVKALSSFDQVCPEHLVSPTKSPTYPAIAPSLFPCRPESPIFMEGLLTEKQVHHGTGKESTEGGRCTYIFCITACADC